MRKTINYTSHQKANLIKGESDENRNKKSSKRKKKE
jgi:hypothetical protein